ncbi:hypothetical protein GCM10027284_22360 [Cyclobacterium sediminis]
MITFRFTLILSILLSGLNSCEKDTIEPHTTLQNLETEKYFDSEIFTESDLKIYGTWELYAVSGGLSGSGHDLNFEYLVIKEYGIYGFVKNKSLLEYGKISPALQTANDLRLKVDFENDEKSNSFFIDTEKYVEFIGNDTLKLYSPCCDRYNYQFKRVE